MTTTYYACGCLIYADMFSGSIVQIIPCQKHLVTTEVQAKLTDLAELITTIAATEKQQSFINKESYVQC
jgi:hypothetical protein